MSDRWRWVVCWPLIAGPLTASYSCTWNVELGTTLATVLLLAWLWFMAYTSEHTAAGGSQPAVAILAA